VNDPIVSGMVATRSLEMDRDAQYGALVPSTVQRRTLSQGMTLTGDQPILPPSALQHEPRPCLDLVGSHDMAKLALASP